MQSQPSNKRSQFFFDQNPSDHGQRYRTILKQHPEIKELFGTNGWTFVILSGLVLMQNAIGYFLNSQPIWAAVIVSYLIGSVIALAIMALVHDASHNLITKSKFGNNTALFVANLGILWPASLAYRRYHLNHHKYFGQSDGDVDMPTTAEARFVGNRFGKKLFWLIFFGYFYVLYRSAKDKKVTPKPLFMMSVLVQLIILMCLIKFDAISWITYLALSPVFSMTIGPAMGLRGLVEHYVLKEGQETYSYYGPLNSVTFNTGYHVEHHDFTMIPWNKLPTVRAIAPTFYNNRFSHQSYYKLVWDFLIDDNQTLFNRVQRELETPIEKKDADHAI